MGACPPGGVSACPVTSRAAKPTSQYALLVHQGKAAEHIQLQENYQWKQLCTGTFLASTQTPRFAVGACDKFEAALGHRGAGLLSQSLSRSFFLSFLVFSISPFFLLTLFLSLFLAGLHGTVPASRMPRSRERESSLLTTYWSDFTLSL